MTSGAAGGLRGWSHSWVGRTSVAGTTLLAVGGFVLSFAALRDLAVRVGMPDDLAWLWPLLAAVVAPELQPEPGPDGGGTPALVDGHANEAPAVEPAVTEPPAALLPPSAPDVEPTPTPTPTPTVEDAVEPPATAEHVPADEEPEAEVAGEEDTEAVEPVVTEEGLGQWVAQQEENGVTVTGSMVADVLGVSASTGRRRLAALRKASQPRLRLAGSE